MLPFDVEATQTELGGLFYLINLGLFLGPLWRFHLPGHDSVSRYRSGISCSCSVADC